MNEIQCVRTRVRRNKMVRLICQVIAGSVFVWCIFCLIFLVTEVVDTLIILLGLSVITMMLLMGDSGKAA